MVDEICNTIRPQCRKKTEQKNFWPEDRLAFQPMQHSF
jgi:hypothetical protein